MGRITIRDVAKEVGVSITTVSRALNGYTDVSEATKKKILEAVERLDYAPDINARSLGGKADTTIALLTSEMTPDDENGFLYGYIYGLFQQCGDQGCEFMLLVTSRAKQEKLSFQQLCKKKNLSGVVVTGLRVDDSYYQEILSSDIPCAMIDMRVRGTNKCRIEIDNVLASKEMTEYVIGLGHKKVALVNGRRDVDVSLDRGRGYEQALRHAGITPDPEYTVYCDFNEEIAFFAVQRLLTRNPEITALVCASDRMAIGAIRAAEELGLRVPEDLSVTGFDDIPIAPYIYKGLTTVRQSPTEIGKACGRAVLQMINKEKVKKEIVLPFELMLRGTTAAVRQAPREKAD